MTLRLAPIALLMLATAGCGGGEPEANEAANVATPTPTPKPVDRRLEAAIAAAFPKGTRGEGKQPRRFDEHRLVIAPFGPILVSYGRIEDAAETVPGVLSIHYLEAEGDGFTVKRAWPEAIRLGSMGLLNGWAVTDRLVDLPTIYAEGATQARGVRCGRAKLVELRPGGPVEIGAIQTGYEEYGAKDGERTQGRIGEIVKGRSFTIDYVGTRSFAERYVFRNGRFVRESAASTLPNC